MKIEEKLIAKTVYEPKQKITFSNQDVEDLILQELTAKGYNVDDVKVHFKHKSFYVYDEWGMNSTKVTKFDGAEIELLKGENNHEIK